MSNAENKKNAIAPLNKNNSASANAPKTNAPKNNAPKANNAPKNNAPKNNAPKAVDTDSIKTDVSSIVPLLDKIKTMKSEYASADEGKKKEIETEFESVKGETLQLQEKINTALESMDLKKNVVTFLGESYPDYLKKLENMNLIKANNVKAEEKEPKANEPKANEPKANEPKANEPKTNEPKTEEKETKANEKETKANEPKAEEKEPSKNATKTGGRRRTRRNRR